jgi:putative transposase
MGRMSYISSYYHCVFSTKERRPLIHSPLRERLWPFLGGIARQNDMKAIEIGGMPDHVHMLLSLPSTLSIAKAMQGIFNWQVKYGAFAVSVSLLDKTVEYIKTQEKHHRKMSFQEEFLALLKKHRIPYDKRYLWE